MTVTDVVGSKAPPVPLAGTPVMPAAKKPRRYLLGVSLIWLVVIVAAPFVWKLFFGLDYASPLGRPMADPAFAEGLWLGTDTLGRSTMARVLAGAQVSMVVGAVAGIIGFVAGTILGLIAGYLRGPVDSVISLLTDTLLAFPALILLLAITATFTPSLTTLTVSLAIVVVPTFIRLARANTIRWSARDFVRAADNMGASPLRIMFREILPNLIPSVAAYLPVVVATLIVAEGSLSFLGLGIPPPTPSWGGMINDAKDYISTNPLAVAVPSTAIFLTVFSFNQIGDYLRGRYGGAGNR